MTSRYLVEVLAAKCAEVLDIEPCDVVAPGKGKQAHAAARMACYQVLRESSWTLEEIGEAFGRNHSTVYSGVKQSRQQARSSNPHAILVSALRDVLEESSRAHGVIAIEARVRARVRALDEEIAASTALIGELAARIPVAQALRAELASLL